MKKAVYWVCEQCGRMYPDEGFEPHCECDTNEEWNEPFTYVMVVLSMITVVYLVYHLTKFAWGF